MTGISSISDPWYSASTPWNGIEYEGNVLIAPEWVFGAKSVVEEPDSASDESDEHVDRSNSTAPILRLVTSFKAGNIKPTLSSTVKAEAASTSIATEPEVMFACVGRTLRSALLHSLVAVSGTNLVSSFSLSIDMQEEAAVLISIDINCAGRV